MTSRLSIVWDTPQPHMQLKSGHVVPVGCGIVSYMRGCLGVGGLGLDGCRRLRVKEPQDSSSKMRMPTMLTMLNDARAFLPFFLAAERRTHVPRLLLPLGSPRSARFGRRQQEACVAPIH